MKFNCHNKIDPCFNFAHLVECQGYPAHHTPVRPLDDKTVNNLKVMTLFLNAPRIILKRGFFSEKDTQSR